MKYHSQLVNQRTVVEVQLTSKMILIIQTMSLLQILLSLNVKLNMEVLFSCIVVQMVSNSMNFSQIQNSDINKYTFTGHLSEGSYHIEKEINEKKPLTLKITSSHLF